MLIVSACVGYSTNTPRNRVVHYCREQRDTSRDAEISLVEFIGSYRRFHLLKRGHMTKTHDLIVYHTRHVLSPNIQRLTGYFAAHTRCLSRRLSETVLSCCSVINQCFKCLKYILRYAMENMSMKQTLF